MQHATVSHASAALSQAPWDTGTEIDPPFNGSLTDVARINPVPHSAAITSPKIPQASGSSVPTNESAVLQTLGSNVPTNASGRPVVADLVSGMCVGEYEIEGRIGEGAMGAVYRAVHPTIGKHVAVKVMNPKLCGDSGAIERFTREARSVAAIRHPGIVDIFGFGTLDDGRAYLIMEWLDGTSLGNRLEHGALTFDEAIDVVDQIARALEAAHDKGITHRDLKPDNIFLQNVLRERPIVTLVDFGLAKLASEEDRIAMTQTGQLLGTPIYMSPEQCRGKGVDHRTDVYALSCVAYELLCGRVPFPADNVAELIAAHLGEQPPFPRSLWPAIPPQLDLLLFAMLAKDPAQRPTLHQVRQVIAEMRGSQFPTPLPGAVRTISPASISSAPTSPYRAPTPSASSTRPPMPGNSTGGESLAPPRRSRRALVIGAVVVLALGAVVAVVTLGGGRGKGREPNNEASGSAPRAATSAKGADATSNGAMTGNGSDGVVTTAHAIDAGVPDASPILQGPVDAAVPIAKKQSKRVERNAPKLPSNPRGDINATPAKGSATRFNRGD